MSANQRVGEASNQRNRADEEPARSRLWIDDGYADIDVFQAPPPLHILLLQACIYKDVLSPEISISLTALTLSVPLNTYIVRKSVMNECRTHFCIKVLNSHYCRGFEQKTENSC